MKNTFFYAITVTLVTSLFFLACSKEKDIAPEVEVAPKLRTNENSDEPVLQSIQSLAAKPESDLKPEVNKIAKSAVSKTVEQSSYGSYVIQVGIFPSKSAANALVAKLKSNDIKAYVAEVENPGELEGTYFRVRVGYFASIAKANLFSSEVLSPLQLNSWVDNKSNDHIGSYDSEYSSYGYEESAAYENHEPSSSNEPVKQAAAKEKVVEQQYVEEEMIDGEIVDGDVIEEILEETHDDHITDDFDDWD